MGLQSFGLPELLVILAILAAIGVLLSAKPLNNGLPYRWATWCAISMGLLGGGAILMSLGFFGDNPNQAEIVIGYILAVIHLSACWGLFRRRRYGVVLLFVAMTLTFNVLMIIMSIRYFRKRWSAMAKDATPALRAESGPAQT
jgi:hypothetical protein